MTSDTVTARLVSQLKTRLGELADATQRNKSFPATEAISESIKTQEWQIKEIKRGIAEADAGQLIAHENIAKRWKKKRANSADKGR